MPDATRTSAASGAGRTEAVQARSGRYAIFFEGRECGEERWRLEGRDGRLIVTGEQEMVAPHPFPNRQSYRAIVEDNWRLTGLEILWSVGTSELRAVHQAMGENWRVQLEYGDGAREQEGDYPLYCEVEYATHLSNTFILAKRDFQLGGEHEFPVLRIGPPHMAVTPDRMMLRCVELGRFASPGSEVAARRYELTLPDRDGADGYTFWADEDGIVLESYEGMDTSKPWMRLVELQRKAG